MKRKELLKYLRNNGCEFLREGGRHSWWHNPTLNKKRGQVCLIYKKIKKGVKSAFDP